MQQTDGYLRGHYRHYHIQPYYRPLEKKTTQQEVIEGLEEVIYYETFNSNQQRTDTQRTTTHCNV